MLYKRKVNTKIDTTFPKTHIQTQTLRVDKDRSGWTDRNHAAVSALDGYNICITNREHVAAEKRSNI